MNRARARPPVRASAESALPTIAGRYRLEALLNTQGSSEVYRALDELTGEPVALKLLPERTSIPQLRAEVSALRLLHLPGVARLFDEGLHAGRAFLAMELVDGTPFPGKHPTASEHTHWAWRELRGTTVALLEVLARVHARGVVHRDLKPDNVLVDSSARPTVLDFGLSAGSAIGSGLDPDRAAVGTPAYAAPEQIRGELVDARADLYALGVMLYEALGARPPQDARLPDEFLQARLHKSPDPLAMHATDTPPAVCALVDRMLMREVEQRPRSALDVLHALRGGGLRDAEPELPWLGSTECLGAVFTALRSTSSVEVVGERGLGKSRFLRELARRLRSDGREVVELCAADEPLASLALLSSGTHGEADSLERALEHARRSVQAELERGVVLLVDDWERLDPWSARVLRDARGCAQRRPGAIVATRSSPSGPAAHAVLLEPLREGDLLPLFQGPDRLFHLREDGARELWRRSEGHPARLADEAAAWVRAGLARWSGAALAIDRPVLARLRAGLEVLPRDRERGERALAIAPHLAQHLAWVALAAPNASPAQLARVCGRPLWRVEAEQLELLEVGALRTTPEGGAEPLVHPLALDEWSQDKRRDAHARLARGLEAGAEGRLLHLISAARFDEVPREACAVARWHLAEGRLGEAEAALSEGLNALRIESVQGAELALFREWIAIALADFTPQAVDRVSYELSRALADDGPDASPAMRQLERFARAAVSTLEAPGERALEEVEAIPPFADSELERWRHALRVLAARGAPSGREELVLASIEGWASEQTDSAVESSLAEWMGRLRYRQERYLEAAAHCERAARLGTRVHARLSAMLNGASALMEASQFQRATALASAARERAADCRHTLFAVRAVWTLRSARYRAGSTDAPDLELVRAASRVGVADQEALISLTEAAFAWRAGEPCARELADHAAALWSSQGKLWGAALARSLALAAATEEAHATQELDELSQRLEQCPDVVLAGQCQALLAEAGASPSERTGALAESLRAELSTAERTTRREVLSVDEVLARLA